MTKKPASHCFAPALLPRFSSATPYCVKTISDINRFLRNVKQYRLEIMIICYAKKIA